MKIIGNGCLFTRDKNNTFFENGAVVFDKNKIVDVGDLYYIKEKYHDAEFIDAHGGIIMPAMINMHEHIYSSFARGFGIKGYEPHGFLDVLNGQWWTIDRNLDNENTYWSAMATYIDSIKCGVTTVFDHHASFGQIKDSLFSIGDAAKNVGIRSCMCYEISDRDNIEKSKEAVLENEAWVKHCLADDSDMIAGMIGMHAQFTISDETFSFAREHTPEGVGYHIHVAEGIEDLYDCLHNHGKRIVNRLFDENILGPKTLLGHCIYINKQEMNLIKQTDTMVVHNPESNMGNACGCPPTIELINKNILCGLGTDGYTHDMLESIKVANILHKHSLCNANVGFMECSKMLWENNAKMANRYFKNKLGVLESGASADIIVMKYNPLTPLNNMNLNGHMIFGMFGHDCQTTICNGKIIYKDFKFVNLDEDEIMAKCRESAASLHKRING